MLQDSKPLPSAAARRSAWAHPWLPYLMIAAVALLVLLPGSGRMPLLDRDEPRFAEATREMMDRHDWVVPYFNNEYRFDKPILTYWLMRGGYALFGVGELGARFHSIIGALLTAMVIFALGRRRFSAKVGAAAALGFLTCLQLFLNGRSATADMPMVLCVAVSQFALLELLVRDEQPRPRLWFWVLYGALGIGFLAKGPIAVLTPALTLLLLRFAFWRRPLPWRRLKLQWGLPVFLAIIGSWGLPALWRTHGLFWQVGMQRHVIDRGMEVFNGRFYNPFFYLITAFFSLSPWIAFAGGGLSAVRRRWDGTNAFLAAWLAAPYLIFTFYATQLPHYVMPGFPAFFLLAAQVLEQPADKARWVTWWRRGALALPALSAVILVAALAYGIARGAPLGIEEVLLAGALLMIGAMVLAFGFVSRRRRGPVLIAGLCLLAAGGFNAGAGLQRLIPAAQMRALFAQMPAGTRYLACGFTEGSLVFYSHGQWEMTSDRNQLKQFLEGGGPRLAVVLQTETKVDRYLQWEIRRRLNPAAVLPREDFGSASDALPVEGYLRRDFTGLNIGRFSWVGVRVYYRPGNGRE